MPSSISSDTNSSSAQEQPGDTPKHPIQPKNTYERLTTLIFIPFQWVFLVMFRVLIAAIITALKDRQTVIDGHKQYAAIVTTNDSSQAPGTSNPVLVSMQAEGGELTLAPTTLIQGAQRVNISGNPQFTNIGMNRGNLTTVNNYGGTYGLENLREFVSFAALHDSSEQDPTRRCHPGTRQNVLSRLRHWIDNPNLTDRIFWLHGPAGAGKSAIAQTIAHEYKEQGVVATFFFYRSDPGRNDGNRLFTTIAWQLAFSIPAFKDFIIYALDKTPHLPMKDIETQFEQLVAYAFQPADNIDLQMPHLAPVVIVDGVDECSNEQLQRRFLAVIGNAIKACRVPLRFLIASRPEALIEETLDQFQDFTLRIDLATLDDANRDIEKYLVDQFSVIAAKQGLNPTWPGHGIIQEIVFKSSGNFILAATIIRCVSDEDNSAETQLDIIRNLKPRGTMSPFGLLDELYLEILKRQPDQDFLKTFLALLVGRSSIDKNDDLHKDDAMLMNVSEKELHIKLRKMRSLLKFKPFIDVHHRSFLDFLHDSSRSEQYHVSKQGGLKRYLELIANSIVRHLSIAIEQPNRHEKCRSSPKFISIIRDYPLKIALPVENWQEALRPLLVLQDKLLNNASKPQPCRVGQVMRDFLLHLLFLQGDSHLVATVQMSQDEKPASLINASHVPHEKNLDILLSSLLSHLRSMDFMLAASKTMVELMSSLLTFDCVETAIRVRSVSDAQKLIDLIDFLTNDQSLLEQFGPDAISKAVHLASEIFARVPVLPQSLFSDRTIHYHDWSSGFLGIEHLCQSALIGRILDHNYVVPILGIYSKKDVVDEWERFRFVHGERDETVSQWLASSKPSFVARIQVVLGIAKIIQYIHSMGIIPHSDILRSNHFLLDEDGRVKICFFGSFPWWPTEASSYGHEASGFIEELTYESNIFSFGKLLYLTFFGNQNTVKEDSLPTNHIEGVRQLVERCRLEDPKSRPTIQDVIKEMEAWDFT